MPELARVLATSLITRPSHYGAPRGFRTLVLRSGPVQSVYVHDLVRADDYLVERVRYFCTLPQNDPLWEESIEVESAGSEIIIVDGKHRALAAWVLRRSVLCSVSGDMGTFDRTLGDYC